MRYRARHVFWHMLSSNARRATFSSYLMLLLMHLALLLLLHMLRRHTRSMLLRPCHRLARLHRHLGMLLLLLLLLLLLIHHLLHRLPRTAWLHVRLCWLASLREILYMLTWLTCNDGSLLQVRLTTWTRYYADMRARLHAWLSGGAVDQARLTRLTSVRRRGA